MNDVATALAVKLISQVEGCELRSYPDPASPLYKALSKENLLRKYMDGKVVIPDRLSSLSGTPWTAMFGETEGVLKGQVYTMVQAVERLTSRVAYFMEGVLKVNPELLSSPNKLAACTSLAYNIGLKGYASSTVSRKIKSREFSAAADAFLLWNKAGGKVMSGLVKRRAVERSLFLT